MTEPLRYFAIKSSSFFSAYCAGPDTSAEKDPIDSFKVTFGMVLLKRVLNDIAGASLLRSFGRNESPQDFKPAISGLRKVACALTPSGDEIRAATLLAGVFATFLPSLLDLPLHKRTDKCAQC